MLEFMREKKMLLKIFTLEFSPAEGTFNDSVVTEFLKDKTLISVKENFLEKNGKSFLTVVVTYSLKEAVRPEIVKPSGPASKVTHWKELITEENQAIFANLRGWRLEESQKQGFPPFIIFTNKQLADIAVLRPSTLNQLSQIDGIGPAKLQKYGEKILNLVANSSAKNEVDIKT